MSIAQVEELAHALGGGKERCLKDDLWMTLCPCHNDTTPSLELKVGDHVPVVWYCRSRQCHKDDITKALKESGLWPRRDVGQVIRFTPRPVAEKKPDPEADWIIVTPVPDDAPPYVKPPDVFRMWEYRDADRRLLGYVKRVNKEGGKEFSPVVLQRHRVTGKMRWWGKAFPEPRPLYGLWRLSEKPNARVLIVAGEKCADAGERTVPDYVSVSASGGEGAAAKSDWTPLNGRDVTIWADQDAAGRKFAASVKELLLKLDANRVVHILSLPDKFPPKFDIADAEDGSKSAQGAPQWTPEQIATYVRTESVPQSLGVVEVDGHDASQFITLGHDGNTFFFRRTLNPQILEVSANTLGKNFLLSLAPLAYWESRFMGKSGCDWVAAVGEMLAIGRAKGIFRPHEKRGRGAWEDGGKLVWHGGSKLFVDGKETKLSEVKSRWVYEAKPDLNLDLSKPLNDRESEKILVLCRALRWRKPVSAYLFAGWMVLAPFGGALKWRPHLWLSGPAAAGKSTILDRIVNRLLAETPLYLEGPSTAAGIRGALDGDSLPVIFDEAERNGKAAEKRIEDILELIMSASGGGGTIVKGTSDQGSKSAAVRACFCLASINTAARDTQAAARRITLLEIEKLEDRDQEHWKNLRGQIEALPHGERVIARTLKWFDVLRRNIEAFKIAVAEHLDNQALGDQLGPLMAGAYLLKTNRQVTESDARKFVAKADWREHALSVEDKDEERTLARVLGYVVRMVKEDGRIIELSVGQLVQIGIGINTGGVELENLDLVRSLEARAQLLKLGVRVEAGGEYVYVAHRNAELEKVFRDTPWARNWSDSLERLPGAQQGIQAKFASGRPQRAVGLPLPSVFPPEVKEEAA